MAALALLILLVVVLVLRRAPAVDVARGALLPGRAASSAVRMSARIAEKRPSNCTWLA
jgi:hypothetical protein